MGRSGRWALGLVVLLGFMTPGQGGAQEARIDSVVGAQMRSLGIPGMAIGFVEDGQVAWQKAYGWADVAGRRAATVHTPFQIASVSKPVTAVVLMSLHASGQFSLDDDVSDYLPFALRNPNHPEEPITFAQLLRHRSSLRNRANVNAQQRDNNDLEDFVRSYFDPSGALYSVDNFYEYPPGEAEDYCNVCYALLALIAQEISGTPYAEFSREVLFGRLGMNSTAWSLNGLRALGSEEPATPYHTEADSPPVALEHNRYPDWPAGLLRSSINDMARFLAVYLRQGEFEGAEVIDPNTIDLLSPARASRGFYTWFQFGMPDGRVFYGHAGGDPGVRTFILLSPTLERGLVILTNGESLPREAGWALYSELVDAFAAR